MIALLSFFELHLSDRIGKLLPSERQMNYGHKTNI
jgi:hypothetical protein